MGLKWQKERVRESLRRGDDLFGDDDAYKSRKRYKRKPRVNLQMEDSSEMVEAYLRGELPEGESIQDFRKRDDDSS